MKSKRWFLDSDEKPLWHRFIDLALVLTNHVRSVYEVLWILDYVLIYEAMDRAKSVCSLDFVDDVNVFDVFHSQHKTFKDQLPNEMKKVKMIQSVLDLKN